jgi:hypothetical protein
LSRAPISLDSISSKITLLGTVVVGLGRGVVVVVVLRVVVVLGVVVVVVVGRRVVGGGGGSVGRGVWTGAGAGAT